MSTPLSCSSFSSCVAAEMEAKGRLRSSTDPGFQARIDEAHRLEEEDRERGDPMVRGWFTVCALG